MIVVQRFMWTDSVLLLNDDFVFVEFCLINFRSKLYMKMITFCFRSSNSSVFSLRIQILQDS